jgi:hypothetical protein
VPEPCHSTITIEGPRYAQIPEALLYDPNVGAEAVRVYGVLLRHGERPDNCYPGHERIATLISKSPRSINRFIAELEHAGWVSRVQRRNPHTGNFTSCSYIVRTAQGSAPQATGAPNSATEGAQTSGPTGALSSATKESKREREPEERQKLVLMAHDGDVTVTLPPPTFDACFWPVYPRHTAKADARRAWDKALRVADAATIVAGAARYRDDPNREDEYTCHPATWLNGQRWNDDPLPARRNGKRPDPTSNRPHRPLRESMRAARGGGR